MQDRITEMTEEVETKAKQQSSFEIDERHIKEEILQMQEHAEVIKKQNKQMYMELEELNRADEFVREKLMRYDVVSKLKQRNAEELGRSYNMVDRSRSPEKQRELALGGEQGSLRRH